MSPLTLVPEIAAALPMSFHGIDLPERFTAVADECRIAREGAAVFDASLRTWLRMRGEDRGDFLQGMVTNDVKALQVGQGVYAALLTQQGRVVTDLRVHAGEDHFLLDLPAHAAAASQAALERYIVADDVEIEPDGAVLIGLEGPACERIITAVAPAASMSRLSPATLAGCSVRLAPSSQFGGTGVLIGCAADDAAGVWQALRAAGAEPVGFEALDVLRVEAGIPWVGVDMDEETLVMEADLAAAISFNKGCYLGQEVVERIAARGHVNRKRTGLVFSTARVAPGAVLSAADKEIGWVTSCVRSPRLGKTIGMGYVRREQLEAGTVLAVAGGGAALVAELPFVRG